MVTMSTLCTFYQTATMLNFNIHWCVFISVVADK